MVNNSKAERFLISKFSKFEKGKKYLTRKSTVIALLIAINIDNIDIFSNGLKKVPVFKPLHFILFEYHMTTDKKFHGFS